MYTPQNIFEKTRSEINDFINNQVHIVDGYAFNQYSTIKKDHLYYNSRFVSGDLDANGRKKLFRNINKAPCKVSGRFLNFDTKDIRLIPINNDDNNETATFLLQEELKLWVKENGIANLMNEIADYAPIYGSAVIKKTKKSASLVDLRRMFNDPTVKWLKNSRFIILEHNLTPTQLREKEKDGWENVEDVIAKFYTNTSPDSYADSRGVNQVISSPLIKIHECYGEVPESWLSGKSAGENERLVRSIFVVAGVNSFQTGEDGQTVIKEDGIILFREKWTGEWPFKDYHYDKTEGRWLGIGVVEDLWAVQERVNELTNQKRESMEISSKHIFQTQDPTILKSIINDVPNGAVLKAGPNGGLTVVPNEERNLGAFNGEENLYKDQAKELTFSYDAIRGEQLPTSTPATNAVIQDRNASSVFAFKRQNLGIMYTDFFNDFVIPQCINDLNEEHILNFIGSPEDIAKIDSLFVKNIANTIAKKKMLSGEIVDFEQIKQDVSSQLKEYGANRFILILKDYYKNAKFKFDINMTNEQEDTNLLANNIFSVFTALIKAPQALQDPILRELFYTWAEKVGVSPMKLETAENSKTMMQQIPQGQMQMPQMPQILQNQQQIPAIPQLNQ